MAFHLLVEDGPGETFVPLSLPRYTLGRAIDEQPGHIVLPGAELGVREAVLDWSSWRRKYVLSG